MKRNNTLSNAIKSATVTRQLQRLGAVALVAAALFAPATTVYAQTIDADTGDAPDSTNHYNHKMEAYPGSGIIATFPTVFDDPSGVPGPIHWYPTKDSWLGPKVTGERDADVLPDADGVTNIDPTAGVADRDGADDGVYLDSLALPDCDVTAFKYNVTVAGSPGPTRYVNVWFDFNRDGDWDDTLLCHQGSQTVKVPEWAVQDQAIAGNLLIGAYDLSTPKFWSMTPPSAKQPMWMRITLSEQKAPASPVTGLADGRGISFGYRTGETEDYLLTGK